jgi:hypothetical protein
MGSMNVVQSPSVPAGSVYYSANTNQVFVNTETNTWQPAREQDKPMSQNKSFLVTFVDKDAEPEYIEAASVEEKGARLVFTEYVNGSSTVKKSLLGSLVASYEVVKPEDKPLVPKYAFRFNLKDGKTLTADGDKVLFTNGSESQPGRYTVVTEISPGSNRNELLVPEDLVGSVERVTESVDADSAS